MHARRVTLTCCLLLALFVAGATRATLKNPSDHRVPLKPLVGNVIFGNELPFQGEDRFVGVKDEFVLGQDKTIQCRAYYPMLLGELWQELRTRAEKVLVRPQLRYHYAALDVFGAETDEKLFTLQGKVSNPMRMAEWDQESMGLLAEGSQKCDLWADKQDESWAAYPMKYPFPDALAEAPGRYRVEVRFCSVLEGRPGEEGASWDEWAEELEVTAEEGRATFTVARGTFTLVVPEPGAPTP